MENVGRSTDVELQQLRLAALSADAPDRTRAVRELLRMDWRRAREAIMALLVTAPWSDRAVVLRALASRADPVAKEALPHVEAAARVDPADASPEARALRGRALAEVSALVLRHDQTAHARALCHQALETAPDAPSLARARALHLLGAVMVRQREHRAAVDVLRESVTRYEALGEPGYASRALDTLGAAHANLLDLAESERCYTQSLALKVAHEDLAGQAITLGGLGRLAMLRGDLDAAIEFFTRDLRLSQQIGDDEGRSVMANQLGEAWLRKALDARRGGDLAEFRAHLDTARRHVEGGIDPSRRGGSLRDEGFSLMMLGRLELARERFDEAERLLARACDAFRVAHDMPAEYAVELLRGEVARRRGATGEARARVEAAIQSYERLGSIDGQVRGWIELAMVFHGARDDEANRHALHRAEALGRALPRTAATSQLEAMRASAEVGERLVEAGVATRPQVDAALDAVLATGAGLGGELLRRRVVDRAALGAFLASRCDIATATAEECEGEAVERATSRLPQRAAERLRALPLGVDDVTGALRVAMADPLDLVARDQLSLMAGATISPRFAPDEDALRRAIRRAYGRLLGLERHAAPDDALRALLDHAAAHGASHVHLEPTRDEVVVRARFDGALRDLDRLPRDRGEALVEAVKSRAGLDLARRDRPQSGRAPWPRDATDADPRAVELGVSTFPSTHGERVVLRAVSRGPEATLVGVGVDDVMAARLVDALSRRGGLLLVAGPPGSGRSTTLRALLAAVDTAARAALLLDDDVHGEADEVPRTRVDAARGFGLAAALAEASRQDVDVLALDELRDPESARVAANLAQSGALVLATLHAHDAVAALTRLAQWGVSSHQIAAVVRGVVAQRLVPRLCAHCKMRATGHEDIAWLTAQVADATTRRLEDATPSTASSAGCARCGLRGYDGVVALYEHLELGDALREQLRRGADESTLREAAARGGARGLAAAALDRWRAGDTSLDALRRAL